MTRSCRLLCGFLMSCVGWTGIIISTSTNNWVVTCKYGMHTCRKMDELETKGLWTECIISTALYHCISLNQILEIPAYIQTSRALMVTASLLGLPSLALVLLAMPCVKLSQETEDTKCKRAVLCGIVILLICYALIAHILLVVVLSTCISAGLRRALTEVIIKHTEVSYILIQWEEQNSLCGMVSTIWFPIGVLHEDNLMSFGFSLYAGWVGSALCFFGGSVLTCCSRSDSLAQSPEDRYYYSNHRGVTNSASPINSHAKSAHV